MQMETLEKMNKGTFKKDMIPWNKGMKGLHMSPETEFKEGGHVGDKHPCWKGGVQKPRGDCIHLYTGLNSRVRRPKTVWEEANGPMPEGLVIYHTDGDNRNDELWNLEVISRGDLLRRNKLK